MERRSAGCRTSCTRQMLRRRCGRWASSGQETETKTLTETNQVGKRQTWNLSKILHRRIFRLKILQRQFHLISTVLVRKNTRNE